MSPIVSDRIRQSLSQSLPLVQAHKHALIDRMEESLASAEAEAESSGQAEIAAMMLVELLIGQVRHLIETGRFDDLGHVHAEHWALAIDGRHYSRFGDALIPILRDVLGPTLPQEVPSAWCDMFWAVIRAAKPERELVPALPVPHRRRDVRRRLPVSSAARRRSRAACARPRRHRASRSAARREGRSGPPRRG